MPPAPVRITQRARSSPSVAAIASRIGWSSALRLAGLSMVSRATCSAGSSSRSLPPASSRAAATSVEDDQRGALVDRLALLAEDFLDGARVLGLHRHLHLHRLEDQHGVALLDRVAHRD